MYAPPYHIELEAPLSHLPSALVISQSYSLCGAAPLKTAFPALALA